MLLGCGGLWWHRANSSAAFSKDRVPPLGQKGILVAPGLYLIGAMSPSAVYAIDTSEGLILVDSGLDRDAGPLKAEMAKLGLDWRRVRAILITHAHGIIPEEPTRCGRDGATVYAGAGDVPVLAAGGPRKAVFSTFYMPDPAHCTRPRSTSLSRGVKRLPWATSASRLLLSPVTRPGACAI